MEFPEDDFEPPERPATAEIPYQNFGANVGDDYAHCDRQVFDAGHVLMVSPLDKESTQKIVAALRDEGWAVDWHWQSSRLVVKAHENMERMSELREVFRGRCGKRKAEIAKEIAVMTRKHERERSVFIAREAGKKAAASIGIDKQPVLR